MSPGQKIKALRAARKVPRKGDACVTIPIYRESPTDSEVLSLKQVLKVLGNYPIFAFVPESLDITVYLNEYKMPEDSFIRFDDDYFEGPESYSELLLSPDFYEHFLAYEYLLIYQLDAFVFKDELAEWVAKGYDYIGAPWYGAYFPNSLEFRKGLPIWRSNLRIRKLLKEPSRMVGNGGLSLRKVRSCYKNLIYFERQCKKWHCREYEDTFFAIALPNLNRYFKIPKEAEAKYFSLELAAKEKIEEMGQLPFGCHAWEKQAPDLWENYIKNPNFAL